MLQFKGKIKKLRKEKDMTQEQLAEYMGVFPQAVIRWKTGATCPDIFALPSLAELFGISVDELLGVDEKEKQKDIRNIIFIAEEKLNEGIIDEPICKGDSIIWFSAFENKELSLFTNHDIPIIEVKDCVKGLTDWFLDNPFHCNAKANTEIAKNIFSYIKQHSNNISTYKRISIINSLGIELYHDPFAILNSIELNNYIKYLEQNPPIIWR